MDQSVTLTEREWQAVITALANQPWHIANPLLMRIGEQLRNQQPTTELRSGYMEPAKSNSGDEIARQTEAARRNFGVDKPQ